jgi:hypothetical protein
MRIVWLEFIYPPSLTEQEKLNRFFLSAIILLTVAVLVLGTWMNFWESEKQIRRAASDERVQKWGQELSAWQKEMEEYLKRRKP